MPWKHGKVPTPWKCGKAVLSIIGCIAYHKKFLCHGNLEKLQHHGSVEKFLYRGSEESCIEHVRVR